MADTQHSDRGCRRRTRCRIQIRRTCTRNWKPRVNPWLIAATVALAAFMEVLDTSIANVALPHIAGTPGREHRTKATWVLTSYLVSNAIVLPLGGWASSLMGRRNFFVFCITDFHGREFFVRRGAFAAAAAAVPRDSGRGRRRHAAHGAGHHGGLALSRTSAGRPLRSMAWWRCLRRQSGPRWAAGLPTTSRGAGSSSSTFRSAFWRSFLVTRLVEDPPWIKADRSQAAQHGLHGPRVPDHRHGRHADHARQGRGERLVRVRASSASSRCCLWAG